jgi:hypothetical protein
MAKLAAQTRPTAAEFDAENLEAVRRMASAGEPLINVEPTPESPPTPDLDIP